MRDYNSKKTNIKNIAAVIPTGKKKSTGKHAAGGKNSASAKTKTRTKSALKETEALGLGLKPKARKKTKAAPKKTTAAKTAKSTKSATAKKAENLKIIPIGGLNEIGKNMTVLEYKDQIMIIDCGMSFPEDEMYGIDVVIPDFSYVVKNASKIKGVVITHGHEDHIGGVPYLLKKINVPIYGTRITLGLIENKLKEHGITGDLRPIKAGDKLRLGDFKVETIRTTHSVADAICLYVQTPAATLFHTGDFKIDYTPIDGEPIDLQKFAEIGSRGVDIMLADSTNAVRKGFTQSEKMVGQTLDGIFSEAENRIIIATFSSNVHRVQKIIELAHKYGRKFSVSGRSMENVVGLAQDLGYLHIPAGSYVELNKTKNIPDNQLVIITTGSQGEPMSALARMASDEHKNVKLKKGDTVILSSSPVPGNEKTVSNVVNRLYEKEVHVIYNEIADIHVSGHACQEELKLIHSIIKPKFFMPVHGEHRHLVAHKELAAGLGMKESRIHILNNGDQLTVDKRKAVRFENVAPAEDILVDGLGVGDVGNVVLKDRKLLSESGLIIVAAGIDQASGTLVSGPDIVTRGFVYVKENEDLINSARKVAEKAIEDTLLYDSDWNTLKNVVRDELRRYIYGRTKRSPVILPMFLDV